jgi:hypothetical protein
VVVTEGLTVGLDAVELNPGGVEVQLYVFPPTEVVPIIVGEPEHIVCGLPALAAGNGLTVIVVTDEDAVPHAPLVTTQYKSVVAVNVPGLYELLQPCSAPTLGTGSMLT